MESAAPAIQMEAKRYRKATNTMNETERTITITPDYDKARTRENLISRQRVTDENLDWQGVRFVYDPPKLFSDGGVMIECGGSMIFDADGKDYDAIIED